MKKYEGIKVITAIMVAFAIISFAILAITPQKLIYKRLYEEQEMQSSGLSLFEATLNYDCILSQVMDQSEVTGMTTYQSSASLCKEITRVQSIYKACRIVFAVSFVLSIVGLVLMRKRKWYHCLNIGGWISLAISGLITFAIAVIPALRGFIFQSNYSLVFGSDPLFVSILPIKWAFFTWLSGLIIVVIISILFLFIHLNTRKEFKPHKF